MADILLVEDEYVSAMLIKRQMTGIGYPVDRHFTSGEKAIASARDKAPDFVLMDILLAGELDGIDTALALREIGDFPVVFITGYDDAKIRARAEEARPAGYLVKPIVLRQLRETVERILGPAARLD